MQSGMTSKNDNTFLLSLVCKRMESTKCQLETLIYMFKVNNKDTKIIPTDVVPVPSPLKWNRHILIG